MIATLDRAATGGTRMAKQSVIPPRRRPDDFEVVFVEQGRDGCEPWYRARRTTIDRWLEECGKEALIAKRSAYVKSMRKEGKWLTRGSSMIDHHQPRKVVREQINDRRRVSLGLARRAAHYLQCVRNGGWVISIMPDGNWRVGTRLRSPGELLDLAVRKGFDVKAANLQIRAEEGEN